VLASGIVAGLLALLTAAPPAEADRGNTTTTTEPDYVPPQDTGNPPVVIPVDLDDEEEDDEVETDPAGTGVDVSPGIEEADPAVQVGGAGDTTGGAPAADPSSADQNPAAVERPRGGGILSKTGADSMALVRTGLAAVALGAGFVLLGRRRRAAGSAA
jgi:hypothetical protein